MNKAVQILFFITLLPLVGNAREETMEERKQRVTRKYLRERVDITQSDMHVPEYAAEDERVTDSEQYKELDGGFARQEEGTMLRSPAPKRRPAPRPAADNWLLADAELEDDPYSTTGTEKKDDYWALWGDKSKSDDQQRSSRREQRSDPYSNRDRSFNSREGGIIDPRSSMDRGRSDIFGRRTDGASSVSFGTPKIKTYGSSLENGLLDVPFSQTRTIEIDRPSESQRYTPHKSPYQTDRNARQQQRGVEQPKLEYKKPDSYQKWKDRSKKTWDPTSDGAYLDEIMQKNRR